MPKEEDKIPNFHNEKKDSGMLSVNPNWCKVLPEKSLLLIGYTMNKLVIMKYLTPR